MEKLIPFKKDIVFKTKLYDVTSISLEHTLKLEDESSVAGEFLISGTYKMSEVSPDESFSHKIPFDIILDERYDSKDMVIDIDDFYYEIIDNEVLRVNIEVFVSGTEKETEEVMEVIIDNDVRDASVVEEVVANSPCDVTILENNTDESVDANEIFQAAISNREEHYVSYHVHIVRNDESIESILAKYNVSLEQLEEYNDLANMSLGTKLIIPAHGN